MVLEELPRFVGADELEGTRTVSPDECAPDFEQSEPIIAGLRSCSLLYKYDHVTYVCYKGEGGVSKTGM